MTAPSLTTVEAARDALVDVPDVESVALLPAGKHRPGTRRVSIVLPPGYDRVPPRVLRCVAEHDLGVADVSRQGEQLIVAAV